MNPPNVITTVPSIGRRSESRLRVRLDTQLITLHGTLRTGLADISASGARIVVVGAALRPGEEAVLQWCGKEAFGIVVWTVGAQSGLCFYDPLAPRDLAEIRRTNDATMRQDKASDARNAARAFVQGMVRL